MGSSRICPLICNEQQIETALLSMCELRQIWQMLKACSGQGLKSLNKVEHFRTPTSTTLGVYDTFEDVLQVEPEFKLLNVQIVCQQHASTMYVFCTKPNIYQVFQHEAKLINAKIDICIFLVSSFCNSEFIKKFGLSLVFASCLALGRGSNFNSKDSLPTKNFRDGRSFEKSGGDE